MASTGASAAWHPAPTSHSIPQLGPQLSPTPDLAALLEQQPNSAGLQPLDRSAEPKAAGIVALQSPVPQPSSSLSGDDDHSSGDGSDGCSGDDGDCSTGSSFGGSDRASGGNGIVSTVGGGSDCEAGSGNAAVENALAPVAPVGGADSSGDGSPAGENKYGTAEKHGESLKKGSAGVPAQTGAGKIANPASPTAQQLLSGQLSFSEFYSQWQESTAGHAQSRVRVQERGRGPGSSVEGKGQHVSGGVRFSAKEDASRRQSDLCRECALLAKAVWLTVLYLSVLNVHAGS